jgi:2-polyprenyl-6-methoxyphenol hydroxylase-like FAD-dependent oxidoreductase
MRVAVIGAGPAGCAAAIELRRRDLEVILVGDGADAVGEQLHPSARPLLEQLRLWPLEAQIECVGVRSAWDGDELHGGFRLHPFGHGCCSIAAAGRQLRRAASNAERRAAPAGSPAHAAAATPVAAGIRTRDRASWLRPVIDASGRRGVVARLLEVPRRRWCDR